MCEEAFDLFDADSNGILDDQEMAHFVRFNFARPFDFPVDEDTMNEMKEHFDTDNVWLSLSLCSRMEIHVLVHTSM
jgi:Ca2+-binding EF-hand superfamily protein